MEAIVTRTGRADDGFALTPGISRLPAAEAQAIDRTHRIGQTRPVTVYRLVSAGTIEEAIADVWRQVAATPAVLPAAQPELDTYVTAGRLSAELDADTTGMLLGEVPAAFHAETLKAGRTR